MFTQRRGLVIKGSTPHEWGSIVSYAVTEPNMTSLNTPHSSEIPEAWLPRLDPEWVAMWQSHGRLKQRADEVDVADYRENPSAYSFTYANDVGPDVPHVEDIGVLVKNPTGEVKTRLYAPRRPADPGAAPLPVHFNMHGGGWVLGGLYSEQAWCRHVCNEVGITVIDIDYRLGPEYKFPVAIYDCWTVVKYV